MLTGKVFCGECGGKYCGNRQHNGRKKTLYYCYRYNVRSRRSSTVCHNSEISRDRLESYVLKLLVDILFDKSRFPAVIEEYNKTVRQRSGSMNEDRKRLKKSIKGIENELDNIMISKTGSDKLLAALENKEMELGELRKQLSELERKSASVDIDRQQIERAFLW